MEAIEVEAEMDYEDIIYTGNKHAIEGSKKVYWG